MEEKNATVLVHPLVPSCYHLMSAWMYVFVSAINVRHGDDNNNHESVDNSQ